MGSFSAHATNASRSPPLVVVFQEYIQLPGREAAANPFEAVGFVGVGVNAQIFMAIAAIELASIDVPYGDGEPGDYGFDPLKFLEGKSEYEVDRMKLKELKNARLAMVAFLGMAIQTLLFPETKLLGNVF